MTSEVITRSAVFPPMWKSVLAVIAHPDDGSFGLGAILDAFFTTGARVRVLCLTHGETWTLHAAPGDLATLLGADLASVDDILGTNRANRRVTPDGTLSQACQTKLANEVVAVAKTSHPDGMLLFDTAGVTDHLDHVAATAAGLVAAEILNLQVLGWTLPESIAAQLNPGFDAGDAGDVGRLDEDLDLRATLDRARQRLAGQLPRGKALPGSVPRRRLELLADTGCLRWLRPPLPTT